MFCGFLWLVLALNQWLALAEPPIDKITESVRCQR
jgi:hypothetical protein